MSSVANNIHSYRRTLNATERIESKEERTEVLNACHKRCALRTLHVLQKNGSIFIKLGQHLSSMNYLLPLEWTTTFIPLQDQCPVSSYESIEEMFLKDTGKTIDETFSQFDREPIGAASLAQVHIGVLRENGQKVAVKVQHPALDEWVPLDLSLTSFTFDMLKKFFPEYDLSWLADEMENSLPQELDFRREGENAHRASDYFREHTKDPLVIPKAISSRRRILIMEYVSGRRPDDLKYLEANGIDRDEVSASLARVFNEMIFGEGAPLHCDPHGGNIAIRKNDSRRKPNFDIILYDHGLYRDIPAHTRRSYAKLWLAVLNSDEPNMRKYSKEVAGISDDQFPLFASAITGRHYNTLRGESIMATRTSQEKAAMTEALGGGMLQDLVILLGNVPRIILLILKTNDLSKLIMFGLELTTNNFIARSLDENLHTRHGPLRTFLILARYATVTVFNEQMETMRGNGSILWPRNLFHFFHAWLAYLRVEIKLDLYETFLDIKSKFVPAN